MSFGVAIVGAGIIVQEEYLPIIQSIPGFSLKGIYSRTRKSAEALQANVDIYSDDSGSGHTFYDLLRRDDVHGLIIALPILVQPELIQGGLAAGKHVLSEKPIAANLAIAKHLITYSQSNRVTNSATWSVAENFRFLDSFRFAKEEIRKLGRVLGFRVKKYGNIKPGDKYFETPWRKKPGYHGGFLTDASCHFIAATRLLLGEAAQPVAVSAYTSLLQQHLAPVDTVDAVWRTKSGVSGTFSHSFGTTLSGSEYTVACEHGSVSILDGKVVVRIGEESDRNFSEVDFTGEGTGVRQEVLAWAEGVTTCTPNPMQSPLQALADLEILELMLKSGNEQGASQALQFQE